MKLFRYAPCQISFWFPFVLMVLLPEPQWAWTCVEQDDQAFSVDDRANFAERVFEGTVTDQEGTPVAGALLEWGEKQAGFDTRTTTRTDSEGNYRLVVHEVGPEFRLAASARGYASSYLEGLIPSRANEPTTQDFRLNTAHQIQLEFHTPDGEPIEGILATAFLPGTNWTSRFSLPTPSSPLPGADRTQESDRDGHVVLADLPAELVGIRFETGDYRPVLLTDQSGRRFRPSSTEGFPVDQDYVVELWDRETIDEQRERPEPGVIWLDVREAGTEKEIDNVRFTRRLRTEMWDADYQDGFHRLDADFQSGSQYKLIVFADGYAPQKLDAYAQLTDERVFSHQVQLMPGRTIVGQLTDSSTGHAIRDRRLLFASAGSVDYLHWFYYDRFDESLDGLTYCQRSVTDMAGSFRFVEGEARGTLFVLVDGYERRIIRPDEIDQLIENTPDGRPVSFELAPESTVRLALTLDGERLAVRSASIGRVSEPGFSEHFESIDSSLDGTWYADRLAAGDYSISFTADSPHRRWPRMSVRFSLEPAEKKELHVGPRLGACTLIGRAIPFRTLVLVPQFEDEIQSFTVSSDADGKYLFRGLKEGAYQLHVKPSQQERLLDRHDDVYELEVGPDTVFHVVAE